MKARASCYLLSFDVPHSSRTLLMHGYTGAIDLVSHELAARLKPDTGDGDLAALDKATVQTLIERGYLTDKTQEQEHEYVRQMLDVFRRRSDTSVNFVFQLQGSCQEMEAGLLKRLEGIFIALNKLRERYIGGVLVLDLSRISDTLDFLPALIDKALEWSYSLIVTITPDKARQIIPHLSPQRIQYLRLVSRDPVVNQTFKADVEECFAQVIEKGLKGEWLFYVDAESLAAIEQAHEIARQMKDKSKSKRGKLNFLLVSDGTVLGSAPLLRLKGEFLSVIPAQDVFLHHFVGRFLDQPGQINFKPYFAPKGSTYILDSEGNVFIPPFRPEQISTGEAIRVGQWVSEGIALDEATVEEYETDCRKCEFADSCESCHLSLLCGGACSRVAPASPTHDGLPPCGVSFKNRLERVLPLVLFNKLLEG